MSNSSQGTLSKKGFHLPVHKGKKGLLFILRIRLFGVFPLVYQIRYRLTHDPQSTFSKFFPSSGYPQEQEADIFRDMVHAFWQYGFLFDEYFYFDIRNKTPEERAAFINETNRYRYYNKCNTARSFALFLNKYKTYERFGEFYGRDVILCKEEKDFAAFAEFAKKNPTFICKPFNESRGEGVKVYTPQSEGEVRAIFDARIQKGRPIYCEAYIRQHPALAAFNESSLNTVRFPTVLTGDSPDTYQVHAFFPCLRLGRAGEVVDNAGAGGLMVQVDAATGALYPVARDKANHAYPAHPDSDVVFDGVVLPRWDEAVALAKHLALRFPENRYTGWDLALTEDGWIMVEGNDRAQFILSQISDRVGKKPELDALMAQLHDDKVSRSKR